MPKENLSRRSVLTTVMLIALLLTCPAGALAGKKAKAGPSQEDTDVKAVIDKIDKPLNDLVIKEQSRVIFSPKDAGDLADIRVKLTDLITQYPKNLQLVRPAYQAGMLYTDREAFMDGYELLSFIATQFPDNPYGLKAKIKINQLEKKLGADYFPKDDPAVLPSGAATGAKPAGK